MESKINYTIVGMFLVLLLAGLIFFGYWLGKYGGQQEYDYYYVYITESVSGLSPDASVKYRGVEVGIVEHLGINFKNSEEVEILLKIKHGTPVKVNTTAMLKFFGMTGLAFIELKGGSKDAPLLKKVKDKVPVIPASPSIYARFNESLTILATKSAQTLNKLDLLLNEENLQNIVTMFYEIKMFFKETRRQMEGFQRIIDNGVVAGKRINKAFEKVEAASVSVKKMADNLDENYANIGRTVSRDVRQSLSSFNQLLYDLDILVGDLQRTTRAIETSPADLIFKRIQPRPGPGEKGYHEK